MIVFQPTSFQMLVAYRKPRAYWGSVISDGMDTLKVFIINRGMEPVVAENRLKRMPPKTAHDRKCGR